ncbi:hypothetical protein DK926_19405 [Rhodococcus sp. Eu-32]|uniref:hypothetical protein n=1 Tax=Rhodococcus sp. Eu-32 TaxID=1017319 RepID=UPI000DF2C40D|nr:hypothetical protein [Rhodococcus sp. Eu-32]RRQ26167.1 hypothetical protein DK926_19405 [Rhodococcus sp. Eu-32]
MTALIVLTVDFDEADYSVMATLTDGGWVQRLALTRGGTNAWKLGQHPSEVIDDALSQCTIAPGRLLGVLTPPEHIIITHPQYWAAGWIDDALGAVTGAAYPPGAVSVHARPTPRSR